MGSAVGIRSDKSSEPTQTFYVKLKRFHYLANTASHALNICHVKVVEKLVALFIKYDI